MFGLKRNDGSTYDGACSFFGGVPPLPQGAGYGICLGISTGFAHFVAIAVYLANSKQAADHTELTNSEVYTTAGRSIGTGLTASDVVFKWTWAATLLQSSNVAWQYGVSGPYWYAAGATIQVLLFAILAIEIKRKCPAIHTMLEIVIARWGVPAHLTFLFFGFMTNIIVTAMLILGGAATMEALTGMSTYAACFCIPVPVSFTPLSEVSRGHTTLLSRTLQLSTLLSSYSSGSSTLGRPTSALPTGCVKISSALPIASPEETLTPPGIHENVMSQHIF